MLPTINTTPAFTLSTASAASTGKIHNATAQFVPLFVSVTFTSATTFDQAVATVRAALYPWNCDEPRTPVPPPVSEQQALFAGSHTLFLSYATWDFLVGIAASPLVVSVDGTALSPCP